MTSLESFPCMQTRRLVLRELAPADAAALYAIHGDADAMRWYGAESMTAPAQAARLIDTFMAWRIAGTGVRWGIERRADGALIGTCGLFRWSRAWHSCTIGYELARGARGQGVMHEALGAVLDHGFGAMDLNRVEARVHPENEASLRVLAALGFVREGYQRQAGYWNGAFRDLVQYALLRDEYRAPAG
ncbi:N-acetyltransferase [Burkholderia glumae]|uniref:GNAT family N-acetyltransferase n=1 Tax=Burkholderia glumae TaxID=337 RepID=UPI000F5DC827|nr:GNAT family protein [Burkholderia glumae]MCM2552082.1 GNAT family N-acetyltransferase [Burkholderia glumae]MCQ0033879.1 GNAT family N-acetyltransferase [Burkholderia glumae]MCQ0037611.1 GNAT family N-acetyltransferase [Burkholderia glumae]NVE24949.1 GNAT family N-acetyltransferase [Burkholderia glumae]QGA41004.1 GNAT family N-acetyltransferase [Burkholderia glumae]